MKIPAPNFTQTPNIFYDEVMRTLNEGELRVMLLVIRQTFGWHRLEDWMTLAYLADKTGYERRSVCRIVDRLIEKNLITRRVVGAIGKQKCYYSLVVDGGIREEPKIDDGIETEEEMNRFQKINTRDPRVTPPSDRSVTPPVTGRSPHTKETPLNKTVVVGETPPPSVVENSKDIEIVKDDVHLYALRAKMDWSPEEINEAWIAYKAAKNPVTDTMEYIKGIIIKKRAVAQSRKDEGTCKKKITTTQECKKNATIQIEKEKLENFKETRSEKGSLESLFTKSEWERWNLKKS